VAAPGDYTLTFEATNSSNPLINGKTLTHTLTLTNSVAAKIVATVNDINQPRAGVPISYATDGKISVEILDRFDNRVTTGPDAELDVSIASLAVDVLGTTAVAAEDGVAEFAADSIRLEGPASTSAYAVRFTTTTAAGTQLSVTNTTAFTLYAGPAAKVRVTSQPPTSVKTDVLFSPGAVQILDKFDNPVTDGSNLVIELMPSNLEATLGETVAVTGATPALSERQYAVAPATGFRLRYYIEGNSNLAALTRTFEITAGDPFSLEFSTQPPTEAVTAAALSRRNSG
jgi:hypothetical protein